MQDTTGGTIDVIHHAGLITTDLTRTVVLYERIGFAFTPLSLIRIALSPGEDPVYIGLGNRNAIFERNYLEIVGIPNPEVWAAVPMQKRGPFNIDERLRLYEGLHIMHFGTDDIEAVRSRYLQQGQPVSEIARLQRIVETPDGARLMVAKTLHFLGGSCPEALIQVAQHVTPEYVLQPRYMRHPNGARRLTEVIVCSEAPEALAAKYGRYSDCTVQRVGDLHVVDLGHTRVLVVAPDALERLAPSAEPPAVPSLVGFTVASNDLKQSREFLCHAGVEVREADNRLVVPAREGGGCTVLFEALGAAR